MVNLIENDTVEFRNLKLIRVCCGNCTQDLADFVYVKSLKNFWQIYLDSMNWDAKFKVHNLNIFCECGEKIGIVYQQGLYHLFKKSIKLIF